MWAHVSSERRWKESEAVKPVSKLYKSISNSDRTKSFTKKEEKVERTFRVTAGMVRAQAMDI